MKTANCKCGHEKRDHRAALGVIRYGACKICLCNAYVKPSAVKTVPRLEHDFILNEREYRTCKSWLDDADAETIRHPLGDPELEINRRQMKALLAEYEQNWRRSNAASRNSPVRP